MSKQKKHQTFVMLPAPLKAAIVAEAVERGANMTDVVVEKLAAHFDVPFEPSGIRATRDPEPDQLGFALRMPAALYRRIRGETIRTLPPVSLQSVIVDVLATAYGQEVPA